MYEKKNKPQFTFLVKKNLSQCYVPKNEEMRIKYKREKREVPQESRHVFTSPHPIYRGEKSKTVLSEKENKAV